MEGNIVGFLMAQRGRANRTKHSGYIVTGILGKYRRKGIGTKLFTALEKWALMNEISSLELTVMTYDEAAIRLYQKMEFTIEGKKGHSLLIDGKFVDEYYMTKLF